MKKRKISPQLETKIRLHTLALVVGGWFPPGSPMAVQARRVIFEGKTKGKTK